MQKQEDRQLCWATKTSGLEQRWKDTCRTDQKGRKNRSDEMETLADRVRRGMIWCVLT